jgi:23S rRNA maturation mini-RNase III
MAKLKDNRNWEEEYKKLKINFDRLDRFNDVLYRYYFYTDVRKDLPDQAAQATRQVEAEAKAAQRQTILDRLGLTEEEARILLGGN